MSIRHVGNVIHGLDHLAVAVGFELLVLGGLELLVVERDGLDLGGQLAPAVDLGQGLDLLSLGVGVSFVYLGRCELECQVPAPPVELPVQVHQLAVG